MRDCPPAIRTEIEDLFEEVLESTTGAILYDIDSSRSAYLFKWARFIKDQAAFESTEAFPEDHAKYGIGIYSDIHLIRSKKGLYIYRDNAIELTNSQILINAAFRGKEVVVTFKSVSEAQKFWNLLKTKKQKILKRWPYDELRNTVIELEENRVVIRAAGSVKDRVSEISPAELAALLEGDPSPQDTDPSDEPPGAFDDLAE